MTLNLYFIVIARSILNRTAHNIHVGWLPLFSLAKMMSSLAISRWIGHTAFFPRVMSIQRKPISPERARKSFWAAADIGLQGCSCGGGKAFVDIRSEVPIDNWGVFIRISRSGSAELRPIFIINLTPIPDRFILQIGRSWADLKSAYSFEYPSGLQSTFSNGQNV